MQKPTHAPEGLPLTRNEEQKLQFICEDLQRDFREAVRFEDPQHIDFFICDTAHELRKLASRILSRKGGEK